MSAYLDLFVLLAYFGIIIGIGLAQKSKSESMEGFALGDRQTPWWAVLASILAAEISAATFLGAPEAGYKDHNWTYAQFAIGTILARIIVSYLFIPLFYRHGVISLYEFLGTRFGIHTRRFSSVLFLITRVLAMGTRLYVSAIILVLAWEAWKGSAVSPDVKFQIFAASVVLVTVLTAIYTTFGGIRAVIWTDFIQVGVLVAALGFSIIFLFMKVPGGWATVQGSLAEKIFFDFAQPKEPGTMAWITNVLTSNYTIWAAVIGSTFVTMATHGIDQDTVQRMLTAKNRHESARATMLSGLVDLPIVCSFILVGILLHVFYTANPDPGLPVSGREVFPYFILHQMPAGMRGLVIAGILATAMGSLSTALNALATSFARDFLLQGRECGEREKVAALRWSTVLFAGLIIAVGVSTSYFMAKNPDVEIIPLVMGIMGFTFGSILGIFLLAIFSRTRGSDMGNLVGMSAAIAVVIFLSWAPAQQLFGVPKGREFIIAFPWRIVIGTFVTWGVAACFRTPTSQITSARLTNEAIDRKEDAEALEIANAAKEK